MSVLKQSILRYVAYPLCKGWWFVTRPHTRGVKCLLRCQGKILLVRPGYGHRSWSIPGGAIQKDESVLVAASRELSEEVGIVIPPEQWRVFATYTQTIEYKNDTVTCVYAETNDMQYTVDAFEVVAARWCAIDVLPTPLTPSVRKILTLYEQA